MTNLSVVYYPGPWFVGGAESYVLNIARALEAYGNVAIISSDIPEPTVLEKLRLPATFSPEWRLTPSCGQSAVRSLAHGADVFVNCSPWDYPRPPKGATSTFVGYYAPELRPISGPERVVRTAAASLFRSRRIWAAPLAALRTYDNIFCVSEWTARLVLERWGEPAGVFYPAVRLIPELPKDRLILTVGRIGAGGTKKGHADLIKAFSALELPEWKLVIAGAANYESTMGIVKAWRSDFKDSNVEIVVDPTKDEIEALYGRASIYWHGAGYGAEPNSVGREHFGIAVVEAMSAGAVPLAFEGGGVREIVTSGVNGLLWSSLEDLIGATRRLAQNSEALERLRQGARVRAEFFGIQEHDSRAEAFLRPRS